MNALRDIRILPVVLVAVFGLAVLKIAGLVLDGGYVFDYDPNATKPSWAQENLNFPGRKPIDPDITGSVHGEGHARVAPCWAYRFDYATPLTRLIFGAATHGLDLPMLFGTTGEGDLGKLDLFRKRASREMSGRFQSDLLGFVRGARPSWPTYDLDRRMTRIFDHADREEADPRRDRRLAWGEFVVT